MDKIKELLCKGYFPIQLPPAFSSESFSEKYKKVLARWPEKSVPDCRYEKFSVARSSYHRRVTGIVNPVAFLNLVVSIARFWREISRHYKKSKISLSVPSIDPGLRAISIKKFGELYEAKILMSAGFRYVLITDITSFFPTIYTHAIPWALHGKGPSKRNRKPTDAYFGNILDVCCRKLQDGQTMGLPIGPDTSHIVAEIIGGAIDQKLRAALGKWPNGFRYVDDFYLFFERRDEAEKALAELTKAIGDFELQVNASKTKIVEVRQLVDESWKFNIKKLVISAEVRSQKSDVHNYFESLFSLEAKYKDESLVKYGLKQISSYIIKMDNWPVFEAYLLKCGYSFPNVLQVLANIFSTYKRYGYPINDKAVKRFCETEIKNHALSDHHSEVSWLLWICKELNFKISRAAVRAVETMSSSVCALIVLDLYNSGYTSHNLKIDFLKKYSNGEALKDAGWLLSYEAGRRGWLNNKDKRWIEQDDFFSALDAEDISFYDENLACKPIFEFRDLGHQIDANFFNDDRDIRDEFEFDEMDEEYFDSDSQDDVWDDIFL